MGNSYTALCTECGHRTEINEGGGFAFHLLRCDQCGEQKAVGFEELGELHLRYLKGLGGPYSMATAESDQQVQEEYEGKPIYEPEYQAEIEKKLETCGCGGKFLFNAPARCSNCRSLSLEVDPEGDFVLYD